MPRFTPTESNFDRSFRRAVYVHNTVAAVVVALITAGIAWIVLTPPEERARYQCAAALNPDQCYRMMTGHEDPTKPRARALEPTH